MPAAPLPANESQRLAALRRYEILDTPSEAEFDDLTLLAAEICDTPIALISLIDADRQWFKSKRGLEMSESARDYAFCSYALISGEFLEVPNAAKDRRFEDNPFVVNDPKIRFYAGGPLTTPDGFVLGTLCVVDTKPHRLGQGQREGLAALSRQVVRQMELRLVSREEIRLKESLRVMNSNLEHLVVERTANLRESEERHRALTESANDGIVSSDHESRILSWNRAAEDIFGYRAEEVMGQPLSILMPDRLKVDYEKRLHQYLAGGEARRVGKTIELCGRHKSGREFSLEMSVSTWQTKAGRYFSGIFRDLTEQKEMERQRLRAQRLESLGTLSGGIAHDLNNALTPIMMGVELLRLKDSSDADLLDTMETSARHGAAMVKQLVTFAKGVEGERLLIQPRHLFKELASMISCAFPKNIEVRTKYENAPLTVLGDATQLHQVLLNLCVNARDAMPKGGILTLEVGHADLDEIQPGMPPEAKPGRYVVCHVKDTGTGIPPEIIERIFEPFFTTKGPEKGTGLGLSTVTGIVKSHEGFMQVKSAEGKGTTFSVYLPLADAASAAGDVLVSKVSFRGQGELILVVDDEPAVRQMIRTVLTRLNFRVITAGDGTEALVQVAENRCHLRGVITDVHMPHMGGSSFVRILRRMIPEAGILVTSGNLEDKEVVEFKELGVEAILSKPFTQEDLIEKLELVLSQAA